MGNVQRDQLIKAKGQPLLGLDFDVWSDGSLSMWTHINHNSDYSKVKDCLLQIREYIERFIVDESLCPFNPLNR